MRQRKITKIIVVEEEVYNRLKSDKLEFQENIDGGRWSISDTIREYQKMIDTLTE